MTLQVLGALYLGLDECITGEVPDDTFIIGHIHSEVSEAFECIRNNEPSLVMNPDNNHKPEGLGPELADIIILTAKLAALHGIDLERMIKLKHEYNIERRGAKER